MSLLTNILLYYKLNGNSNNSVSGSFNGVDSNIVYLQNAGVIGKGAVFNGTNSKITFANPTGTASATKISVLTTVLWGIVPSSVRALVAKDATNQSSFFIGNNGTEWSIIIYTALSGATHADAITSGANLQAGVWYSVLIVYDGTATGNANRLKLYVNGLQVALTFTGTVPASLTASTASLLLGNNTGSNFQNGFQTEVALWLDALTQAAATSLYNSGLFLTYPFDSTIYPNQQAYAFATYLLAGNYQRLTAARIAAVTLIQTAAANHTAVTQVQWNNFVNVGYSLYPAFLIDTMRY